MKVLTEKQYNDSKEVVEAFPTGRCLNFAGIREEWGALLLYDNIKYAVTWVFSTDDCKLSDESNDLADLPFDYNHVLDLKLFDQ